MFLSAGALCGSVGARGLSRFYLQVYVAAIVADVVLRTYLGVFYLRAEADVVAGFTLLLVAVKVCG